MILLCIKFIRRVGRLDGYHCLIYQKIRCLIYKPKRNFALRFNTDQNMTDSVGSPGVGVGRAVASVDCTTHSGI